MYLLKSVLPITMYYRGKTPQPQGLRLLHHRCPNTKKNVPDFSTQVIQEKVVYKCISFKSHNIKVNNSLTSIKRIQQLPQSKLEPRRSTPAWVTKQKQKATKTKNCPTLKNKIYSIVENIIKIYFTSIKCHMYISGSLTVTSKY